MGPGHGSMPSLKHKRLCLQVIINSAVNQREEEKREKEEGKKGLPEDVSCGGRCGKRERDDARVVCEEKREKGRASPVFVQSRLRNYNVHPGQ